MKTLLILFSLISLTATAQDNYKRDGNILYNKQAIVIDSITINVGDTVYLSFGSAANKDFSFVLFRPVLFAYDITKGIQPVDASYSNTALVLKQIAMEKLEGRKYSDGIFQLPGSKTKICIDLYNAIAAGEIKRIAPKK